METQVRALLYRVWLTVRENQFTVELVLWAVLLAMIGYEIMLIRGEMAAAGEQMELLRQNTEAATKQAQLLNSMMQEQQKSLRTLGQMNQALQKQLDIIASDQKRRLEELAKKPQLELSIGGVPLLGSAGRAVPSKEKTATKALFDAVLFNRGDATAQFGMVRIMVDDSEVKLSCDCPSLNLRLPQGVPGQTMLAQFERLAGKTWLPLPLTVEYPAGFHEFRICFNADAENFARSWLGCFQVTPPKQEQ